MMLQRLRVSTNGRFLAREDGSPFFYLGDTAWAIFYRLTREEADEYLRDRAARGFTVIQAVALNDEFGGMTLPNAYNELAVQDGDPGRPNEAYFAHMDWIIDRAAVLGLYVGLLPTWGDNVNKPARRVFTPASAVAYGEFFGRRYRNRTNLLWILGGDSRPDGPEAVETWRALARGIAIGVTGQEDYTALLLTYHPPGGTFRPPATSSGEFFHTEPWLAFNMIQSGHRIGNHNWERIAEDYARQPAKPVLDGEPCYEDHLDLHDPARERFSAWHVRQRAYWALFAGACGHTYGHDTIYRFWIPGREGGPLPQVPWREGLAAAGADDMRHARALLESRPFFSRVPDQALLLHDQAESPVVGIAPDLDHAQATRDRDGGYACIYLSAGRPVTLDLERLTGERLQGYWYDPRQGNYSLIGTFPRGGHRRFVPPSSGQDQDWVLVLDDVARGFPPPGVRA
ncbi:MAG TPA: glycoside hydrolase family 140 protein [Thermomicrobiales bacterium]|jgi:hypothetical protein|nr:glycoside hydrolase family 140 protein [Thermomicrobiales bacterium]